jgi:hypothetical protein
MAITPNVPGTFRSYSTPKLQTSKRKEVKSGIIKWAEVVWRAVPCRGFSEKAITPAPDECTGAEITLA